MRLSYAEAIAFLDEHISLEALRPGQPRRAPSLDRITELTDLLGQPQHQYPVIHLTGTNGKTTTARLVARLLEVMNLQVGLYTSPSLERVNERICRNLDPIPDDALAETVSELAEYVRSMKDQPSYFDVLTATAFAWFADVPVDVAVLEVGMLGRYDTTNVARGQVAVVTNVGEDHLDYAGSLEGVAWEKAGIVKPGATLILGEVDQELAAPFEEEEAAAIWKRGVDFDCVDNRVAHGGRLLTLRTPNAVYDDVFLSLHGTFQGDNAACALAAVEAFFDRPVAPEIVEEAFATATSPGRVEVIGRRPLVIVDGAHNAAGLAALGDTLRDAFAVAGRWIIVHGLLHPHDPEEQLRALDPPANSGVIACAPEWPRAVSPEEVADAAEGLGYPVIVADDVADAVDRALAAASNDDLILVTGSIYTVGEARQVLRGRLGSPGPAWDGPTGDR